MGRGGAGWRGGLSDYNKYSKSEKKIGAARGLGRVWGKTEF